MIPIGPLRALPHPDSGDVVVGEMARVIGTNNVGLVEDITAGNATLLYLVSGSKGSFPLNKLVREPLP